MPSSAAFRLTKRVNDVLDAAQVREASLVRVVVLHHGQQNGVLQGSDHAQQSSLA
jgi:hypothetical protein